jgi:restriction system protein
MFSLSSLLLGLLIMLVLGICGTFYFRNVRRPKDEAAAGIRALSAMRWREFSHFVLDAMRHRGYDVLTPADEAERGQQTEFLLAKDGQRWLLGCKHGSAYRLAAPAVAEFAGSIRFQGARGGILVTPGMIAPDAHAPAGAASIELVDGDKLWPEVAPLLPPALIDDVRQQADERVRRQVSLTWLGSVAGGVALGLLLGGLLPDSPAAAETDSTPLPVAVAPAAVTPAAAAAPSQPPPQVQAPGSSTTDASIAAATPADEDAQRVEVTQRVARLPGVVRTLWSTKSTLFVEVDETSSERLADVCSVLERYENLRTARVQLQPPAGSDQRVRFRQCRTF